MYSENLVIKLNDIAHKYSAQIDQSLHDVVSKISHNADIHTEVIDGSSSKAPQIIITFSDHIGFLDKRKMMWTKLPPVEAFEQWADDITFNGIVPGYRDGSTINLPPWKQKIRIAWAIAMDKKKHDSWKARPWRKKSLSSVLKEMNQVVLQEFEAAIDKDFQQAINKGLNG